MVGAAFVHRSTLLTYPGAAVRESRTGRPTAVRSRRAYITFWLSLDEIATWEPARVAKRGGDLRCSDLAIETPLTLRLVFRPPSGQTEGLVSSLFECDCEPVRRFWDAQPGWARPICACGNEGRDVSRDRRRRESRGVTHDG